MGEKGIDISHQRSKAFDEDLARRMDVVVTVCGNADERCPVLPPEVKRLHWPLQDPAAATGSDAEILAKFREIRDLIEVRVVELVGSLLKAGDPAPVALFFATLFHVGYWVGRAAGLTPEKAVTVGFHVTGRNFELSIALALAAFAATPTIAVSTVMGPLIEVPVMLALTRVGRALVERARRAALATADRATSSIQS